MVHWLRHKTDIEIQIYILVFAPFLMKQKNQHIPLAELLRFGIINIDKPSGPTSFAVSSYVRRVLNLNKTSHFGTLDPMVSGVLPVGLGRACRLSDFFMHRDKTYVGIMRLHKEVSDEQLNACISEFIGKISQLPPVRSRVKRAVREREVKNFNILEREGTDVVFSTRVQAGTYIRKLIFDMGEKLGGAHMLELRRTEAGMFDETSVCTLYDLDAAVEAFKKGDETKLRSLILDARTALTELLPRIEARTGARAALLRGKPLMVHDLIKRVALPETFMLYIGTQFIGVYQAVSERGIVARAAFVYTNSS